MSVTYREFLASAEVLRGGPAEIDFRNAASRAYYSAYHACKSVAEHCPKVTDPGTGSHEALILRFKRYPRTGPGHEFANKIWYLMDQAKGLRRRADYEISRPFLKGVTETQICNVKRILEQVAAFEKAHTAS